MMKDNIRNLKDFLVINSSYVQSILKQVLVFNEDMQNIHYSNDSKGVNINFTISYEYNKKKNSIYFCEWYDEKNFKEEFLSFVKDTNHPPIETFPKLFVFITRKNLKDRIDAICKEEKINNLSKLKIIYIEDINDNLGGILNV